MLTLLALVLTVAPFGAQSTTSTQAATAAPVDVLGTWNVTVTTQQGEIPSQLKLRKDGAKMVGTIASDMGESPVEAELTDKKLAIWFTFQSPNGAIPIELNGTVDGTTIKGTMVAAGSAAGDWVATKVKTETTDAKDTKEPAKQPAKATDLSGDWSISLMLDTINATPSLTLKQDGEKLTGEYTSQQYGKFPVTGSVKGSDVTFSVSMAIEGNGITGTYSGTLQPDGSLKGSVNIGDAMTGTFTATKKK